VGLNKKISRLLGDADAVEVHLLCRADGNCGVLYMAELTIPALPVDVRLGRVVGRMVEKCHKENFDLPGLLIVMIIF